MYALHLIFSFLITHQELHVQTTPVWVYCRQTGHCGQGMVFAVNAVDDGPNSFSAFQAKAKQLNGTATASASPTPTGGALGKGPSAGMALALAALVAGSVW
jgi:hypothetical protein